MRCAQAGKQGRIGHVAGPVAYHALGLLKQGLSAQYFGVVGVASGGWCQGRGVKDDIVQCIVIDFWCGGAGTGGGYHAIGSIAFAPTMGCGQTVGLRGCAGLAPEGAGSDADIAVKGCSSLVRHAASVGFPAKASDQFFLCKSVPHPVWLAFDGAGLPDLCLGVGHDIGFRDGFNQPHANDLGCNAWADQGVGSQRAITQLGQAVLGSLQCVAGAVGKATP